MRSSSITIAAMRFGVPHVDDTDLARPQMRLDQYLVVINLFSHNFRQSLLNADQEITDVLLKYIL